MELWTLHWRKKWNFGALAIYIYIYIRRDLSRLLVSHKLTPVP